MAPLAKAQAATMAKVLAALYPCGYGHYQRYDVYPDQIKVCGGATNSLDIPGPCSACPGFRGVGTSMPCRNVAQRPSLCTCSST